MCRRGETSDSATIDRVLVNCLGAFLPLDGLDDQLASETRGPSQSQRCPSDRPQGAPLEGPHLHGHRPAGKIHGPSGGGPILAFEARVPAGPRSQIGLTGTTSTGSLPPVSPGRSWKGPSKRSTVMVASDSTAPATSSWGTSMTVEALTGSSTASSSVVVVLAAMEVGTADTVVVAEAARAQERSPAAPHDTRGARSHKPLRPVGP